MVSLAYICSQELGNARHHRGKPELVLWATFGPSLRQAWECVETSISLSIALSLISNHAMTMKKKVPNVDLVRGGNAGRAEEGWLL
jgi:hypothetical protein